MKKEPIVEKIAYHRNGVSGVGFHVAIVKSEGRDMVVVKFDDDDTFTAALDIELLTQKKISMDEGAAFRGDYFDRYMRNAIDTVREAHKISA